MSPQEQLLSRQRQWQLDIESVMSRFGAHREEVELFFAVAKNIEDARGALPPLRSEASRWIAKYDWPWNSEEMARAYATVSSMGRHMPTHPALFEPKCWDGWS